VTSRRCWRGSKWVNLTLAALQDGPERYNALARRIAGISPKMLTQTLRTLERDGLVERTLTPSVPVQVDYRLTPLGRDLLGVVLGLKSWAEANIATIHRTRADYDASTGNGSVDQSVAGPWPTGDAR